MQFLRYFRKAYGKVLRGAFLVNLESIGAGDLRVLATEGTGTRRKADRRLLRMLCGIANAMNIDTLKKYEANILSFIRDSVGSDSLTMSIRTLTPAERPKFYTKPQRLQILKERYSALDKLCKELDLDVTLG